MYIKNKRIDNLEYRKYKLSEYLDWLRDFDEMFKIKQEIEKIEDEIEKLKKFDKKMIIE